MGTTMKEEDKTKIMIDVLQNIENEISSAIETLEIQSEDEILQSIERGVEDIKKNRVHTFDSFLKKHGHD
jgi:hypothetical protein